ncbi:uncharacterized protein [Aegilops tauschii subsp. strangulata]|uniref:Uncharacterized protein n=2 Tax=Triticinae TaxID=1648030 RepID=A0A453QLN8_AEGTS|nr:uncharacterized protein LOC109771248 [Aegilops tauschii subsp. strangulata]XP_044443228.1 uncharacterized protein LOC123169417 [Triticum aestivum]
MATAPLGVRLLVGAEAPTPLQDSAEDAAAFLALPVSLLGKECLMDSAGNLYARVEALPRAGAAEDALLRAPAGAVVVGSAQRLLALAGAMRVAERLAGRTAPTDRAEPSTAADMDIDSGGDAVSSSHSGRDPGAKRRRGGGGDDAHGVLQRPAKRRILAWRVRRYRSLVAKAKATARRARIRAVKRRAPAWKCVQRQLARATLSCDGLHRWSPGGGGGGGGGGGAA